MCTRVFNNHEGAIFATGRNMDWAQPMDTSLYVFGSDMPKTGLPADDDSGCIPAQWTSRYASVVAMVGGEAASDGINSEGLVANVLYLAGSTYADKAQRKGKKGLSVLRWVQYVLDNCASVDNVLQEFDGNTELVLVGAKVPDEGKDPKEAELHMSVSDRHGASAIIEIVDGKYKISSSPDYRVMTNDPFFSKQLELNAYWRWQWDTVTNTHPSYTLPGSTYSPDRFARADYFINNIERMDDAPRAAAQVLSILRNASVPLGYQPEGIDVNEEPNIAQTLWSTVAMHASGRYYFADVATPNVFWVDLNISQIFPIPLQPGVCMILPLKNSSGQYVYYAGCVNSKFLETTDPFAAAV